MLRGFDTIERDRRRARIGRSGAWHEFRTMAESIDAELMSILVCPESHARLVQVGDWLYSTDPATRRRYPVRREFFNTVLMLNNKEELTRKATELGFRLAR